MTETRAHAVPRLFVRVPQRSARTVRGGRACVRARHDAHLPRRRQNKTCLGREIAARPQARHQTRLRLILPRSRKVVPFRVPLPIRRRSRTLRGAKFSPRLILPRSLKIGHLRRQCLTRRQNKTPLGRKTAARLQARHQPRLRRIIPSSPKISPFPPGQTPARSQKTQRRGLKHAPRHRARLQPILPRLCGRGGARRLHRRRRHSACA